MFAWEEQKHSKNYLIQKHFEDFLSSEYDAKVKPGTVFGTAGGSSDDTIYTFQHLRDAYKNRLALGISKGFPAVNPVLPVAPGYYGYYRAGRLGEVYKADNLDEEKSRERELRYIGENNPEDEYIYDELNGPTPKSFNNYHPSHELHKLEYIWDFRRHLRDKGRSFFYDLERIKDLSKLHPMVLADLVTDNQKYINLAEGKDSQAIEPIAASDFEHELFPLNEASPELAYEYFYLSRPSMRKKLEDDLQMDFSDIPLRSQAQFLHFIEGQSVESFERVKNILTANPDAKLDIIKSFFANAADDAYAETILSIAEQLADDPEAQEELFSKYAQFTDALSDKVHIVQEAHKRIFVFSQLPQSDIFTALVMRANELLVRAEAAIQNQDAASRREIIKKLTENFQNEQETLEEQINEFEKAAAAVREKLKHTNEILRHTPLSRDYAHILDPKELRMEEVIKTIRSKKFKGVSDQFADYLRRDLERQVRQNAKITSELIGSLIHDLRAQMENFSAVNEMTDVLYPDDVDELTGNPQAEKDREDFESKTRPAFIKIIKELSELLKFQKAFEEKFQALITRESEGVLPKGFLSNLEQEVSELKPEALPPEEPLYFPVGISKDLPQWREVFAGEKHAAKPIDMYSYLFWLNNQGKPAQLVVCDEIQISNYQELYGVNKEEAKEGARSIGREEAETYQKIIDTFGLANVEVVDYNTFKEGHEHEIERYRELCEQLAEHPVFRDAFLGMVQESISGTTPEQKKQYLAYGIEELSLILATGGAKVSHQNEARYDTLAAFIKTAQELAIENEETFAGLLNKKEPLEGLTQILNGTIRKMQEKLNDLKKENKNNQEAMQYFTASADVLKGIDRELRGFRGRVADKPAIFKKSFKAKFDFVAPSIGSQSFGWRSKGDKGQKSTVKFREPYSTYFYKEGSEVFLGSDQVVAAPDGLIAGKTLALDDEAQKKYAQETVKPLLSQYFKSLDAAPKAYFEHVGKTQKQLIAECKRSNTLLDVLKFIQRYVVAPSSRNFERSPSGEMLRPATRVEAG